MQTNKLFLLISLTLFYLLGCTTAPRTSMPLGWRPTSATTVTGGTLASQFTTPQTIYHEVGPSETLWRISKTYGVNMQLLMQANNLTNPNVLENGQRLIIPNTLGPVPVIPLYPNRKWTHIVIHHTASEIGNARTIDQMHHKKGWWNGLGYHFLINNGTSGKYEGQIEVGPRWIKQMDGAHAKDDHMNERGIGVSLVGNYSTGQISEELLRSLVYVVSTLQKYYGILDHNVVGHRDVIGANTECPGNLFPWSEFKQRLRLV